MAGFSINFRVLAACFYDNKLHQAKGEGRGFQQQKTPGRSVLLLLGSKVNWIQKLSRHWSGGSQDHLPALQWAGTGEGTLEAAAEPPSVEETEAYV